MNLLIEVTVVLSKGRRGHPSNKSVLWNRSRLVMKCEFEFHRQHSNWKLSKAGYTRVSQNLAWKWDSQKQNDNWKCLVIFSPSEAERTIGFRQPGDPIQTEVAHQSNLNMSVGNQVRINIGNSPEHTLRNILKTSSSYMQIRMTQNIFIPRIFLIFVHFILYDFFPRRVIGKVELWNHDSK